jgi:hypothetical protein
MYPKNDAIESAFQFLTSVVLDYTANGRRCFGATLKPALRRRSNNAFSEYMLGFASFGDFLRAAERTGIVQLIRTPGGDIEVQVCRTGSPVPAVTAAPVTASWSPSVRATSGLPSASGPIRVRPDLWDAFNSFSTMWVYSRRSGTAHKSQSSGGAASGSAGASDPDLVPIPSGRDRVLAWMRSFAGMQDPTTKARLSGALDAGSAISQFNNVINVDPRLHKAWRRFHIQQVLAAVEAWSTSNHIQLQNVSTIAAPLPHPVQNPRLPIATAAPAVVQVQVPEQVPSPQAQPSALTPRLAIIIDQLIDELLRLRGTLQVLDAKR